MELELTSWIIAGVVLAQSVVQLAQLRFLRDVRNSLRPPPPPPPAGPTIIFRGRHGETDPPEDDKKKR